MGEQTKTNGSSSEEMSFQSAFVGNNINRNSSPVFTPPKVVIRETLYSDESVNAKVKRYGTHRETASVKSSIRNKSDFGTVNYAGFDDAATALIGFAVMVYVSARKKLEFNLPGARPNCSYRYYWEKFHCDMWADVNSNRKQLESDISELSTSHILKCLKLLKIDNKSWPYDYTSPYLSSSIIEFCDEIAFTLSVELETPITCDPSFKHPEIDVDTRMIFDKITARSLTEFKAYTGAPCYQQEKKLMDWYDIWSLIVSSSGDETNSEHFESIASVLSMLSNSLYERKRASLG